jgi:DNA-binding XRE family transcriptional regulator
MGVPEGMERYGNLSKGEFAARCRAARAYADLNLDEAGKLLGVSRQALSRRENSWVEISVGDRFIMATVYCRLTGWPETFFTEEKWPEIPVPAEGEVEPEEVLGLSSEPQGDAAQG